MALHCAVWVKGIQLGGYWLGVRGRKSTPGEHLDRAHAVFSVAVDLGLRD